MVNVNVIAVVVVVVVVADTTSIFGICGSGGISNRGGYFCCSNSDINIGCTIITFNIVPSFSGTSVNVTAHIIISIYVIVEAGDGGGQYI